MIPIQVLGSGLIPRGYGLAPRKEPFKADKTLILTILQTPGLIVNFINPETGAPTELTRHNVDRIWAKWANYNPKKPAPQAIQTRPVAPVKPANPPKAQASSSFPEKANQNEVPSEVRSNKADQFQGLPMDSLIGSPLKPTTPFGITPDMLSTVKGAPVKPGNLNDPPARVSSAFVPTPTFGMDEEVVTMEGINPDIDLSQIPEGFSLGLPAEPGTPADAEATLITVTNGESEETTIPEEPVDVTGYRTPDAGESYSEDEAGGESDDKEESGYTPTPQSDPPAERSRNNSFKPILNSDDDREKPNPNYRPNNNHGKGKNHNKNRH